MSSKELLSEFSTENSKLANFENMKDDTRIISENQEFEVQDITNVPKVTDFGNQSGILAVDESNKKDGFLDIEDDLGDGSFQETEEFKVQDNTNVPKVTDFVIKSARLAEEFEVQENTNVSEVTNFAMKTGLMAGGESNNKDGFLGKCLNVEDNLGDGSFQDTGVAVIMKDETRIIPESVSTIQEFESSTKKDETNKGNCLNIDNLGGSNSVRCSLKIEVIDDTAMIDISQAGKRINRKKKKNTNQENGEKRVARKENGPKLVEAKEKHVCFDGCKREGEEKRVYSRKELENLRFSGMEEQRKKWLEVYCGLGHAVQKEYDALIHSNNSQNHFNPRRRRGKENSPVISGGLVANEQGKHLKVYTQRSMTYGNLQRTVFT